MTDEREKNKDLKIDLFEKENEILSENALRKILGGTECMCALPGGSPLGPPKNTIRVTKDVN